MLSHIKVRCCASSEGKTRSLFARGVRGHPRVTLTLCLFSGQPPGSVSNCGAEMCLCYSGGSRLLKQVGGKRCDSGFTVKGTECRLFFCFVFFASVI